MGLYLICMVFSIFFVILENRLYFTVIGKGVVLVILMLFLSAFYGVVVYGNDVDVSFRSVLPYVFLLNYFVALSVLRAKVISVNILLKVVILCAIISMIKSFVSAGMSSWVTIRGSLDSISFSPIISMAFLILLVCIAGMVFVILEMYMITAGDDGASSVGVK